MLLFIPWMIDAANAGQEFDKALSLEGISFKVTCANHGSLNDVTIAPSGLEEVNTPAIIKDADGTITGAEIADINSDGSPEIYVYLTSAGSGSYGTLIAYSTNQKKSMSPICLAPLEDDKGNAKGYMGHDQFFIVGNRLVRHFPIYKEGDTNAEPTGGIRQLVYELVPGEATWQLKLVKSSNI